MERLEKVRVDALDLAKRKLNTSVNTVWYLNPELIKDLKEQIFSHIKLKQLNYLDKYTYLKITEGKVYIGNFVIKKESFFGEENRFIL